MCEGAGWDPASADTGIDTDWEEFDHAKVLLRHAEVTGGEVDHSADRLAFQRQFEISTGHWAAAGPDSYDCSGLTSWAYAQVGVSLPHSSYDQWNYGVPVSKDQLEPGDLVFFDGLGHVGIYVGGGAFVHAPHTGTVVQVSDLTSGYYADNYVGARRIL